MSRKSKQYNVMGLSHEERELLKADILSVAEAEDIGFYAAQELHMKRVGGQRNLRSYVNCLLVKPRSVPHSE